MKSNYKPIKSTILFILFFSTVAFAQNKKSMWNKVLKDKLTQEKIFRKSEPEKAKFYSLDIDRLKEKLKNAPNRGVNSKTSNVIIEFPDKEGVMKPFKVWEASVMQPKLQEKYSYLRSYVGQSIENPATTIRFSITSQGLHTMIFSTKDGTQYMDPYTKDGKFYTVYAKRDLPRLNENFICGYEDNLSIVNKSNIDIQALKNADDGMMREFRLALATTIEYSAFHVSAAETACGCTLATEAEKKAAVMAELTVAMTRLNGIYERDLSLTMKLVSNNDVLIFIDTDSYTNDNGGAMLSENQAVIDGAIGTANYDIGHVFSTGGGGVAFLNSPCGTSKAGGVTGLGTPVGDPFYVDYVAHEMGHQYGAPHTFNGGAGSCGGGNRTASNAYEPGSGSTIMAYAGICSPENVQGNSDAYFHQKSLQMIWDNITSPTGSNCATQTATSNSAPTAEAGNSYTIPGLTPYKLTGSSTDVDGTTTHTYTWEQYDLGTTTTLSTETSTTGPILRSFEGTTNPDRTIPQLSDLITNGGTSTAWEILPSVDRDINFQLTVRDNDTRGGQTATDNMIVTVDGDSGPFKVTSQNTTGILWNNGDTETVTWDIANTDNAPINTSLVNILLSLDGGLTYPITLASNTANDGTEDIIVPNNPAPYCRIKVEAVDNIYFAINTENFALDYTITTTCTTYSSASNLNLAIPDNTGSALVNTISISDSNTIDYISVNSDISHTFIRDLTVDIQHPDGSTSSTIWNRVCNGEDDLDITFKDGNPEIVCASPTVGNYKPSSPLSVFSGLNSSGDWNISILDHASVDTGNLNDWSIEICSTTTTVLSVDDQVFSSFTIFPNPSSGIINISLLSDSDEDIKAELFDLIGRKIKSKKYSSIRRNFNEQFKYGSISEGIYILKVSQGNKVISKRVVVNSQVTN